MAVPAVRITLLDPPFAYGREMVLSDGSRVPYDETAIAAQQERDRFPSSIQHDSEILVESIGAARIVLADLRDAARLADVSPGEQARTLAILSAMLREAA
jgi:hypothetical protein